MSEARVQPAHPEHGAGWTDERTAILKNMWLAGSSASDIMHALGGGVTRSGVIGKVHRLKLPKRAKDVANTTRAQRADAPRQREPVKPRGQKGQPKVNAIVARASMPAKPLPAVEVLPSGIGLLALTPRTCRWPVGEATGAKQLFCGAHASLNDGQPYCPRHTAKAEYRR